MKHQTNVTIRSNIYVNRTRNSQDISFLQHLTDYNLLEKESKKWGMFSTWMTNTQKQIVDNGPPQCVLEHGTQSWGVPLGSDELHCRCEETQCNMYGNCVIAKNFDVIVRETPITQPAEPDLVPWRVKAWELGEQPVEAVPREELQPVVPVVEIEPEIPPELVKTEETIPDPVVVAPEPPAAVEPVEPSEIERERLWVKAWPGYLPEILHSLKDQLHQEPLTLCSTRNMAQSLYNALPGACTVSGLMRQLNIAPQATSVEIADQIRANSTYFVKVSFILVPDYSRLVEEEKNFVRILLANQPCGAIVLTDVFQDNDDIPQDFQTSTVDFPLDCSLTGFLPGTPEFASALEQFNAQARAEWKTISLEEAFVKVNDQSLLLASHAGHAAMLAQRFYHEEKWCVPWSLSAPQRMAEWVAAFFRRFSDQERITNTMFSAWQQGKKEIPENAWNALQDIVHSAIIQPKELVARLQDMDTLPLALLPQDKGKIPVGWLDDAMDVTGKTVYLLDTGDDDTMLFKAYLLARQPVCLIRPSGHFDNMMQTASGRWFIPLERRSRGMDIHSIALIYRDMEDVSIPETEESFFLDPAMEHPDAKLWLRPHASELCCEDVPCGQLADSIPNALHEALEQVDSAYNLPGELSQICVSAMDSAIVNGRCVLRPLMIGFPSCTRSN